MILLVLTIIQICVISLIQENSSLYIGLNKCIRYLKNTLNFLNFFLKESSWGGNISFYELCYSHEELNYSLCGVLNFPLFDIRDKSDLKT